MADDRRARVSGWYLGEQSAIERSIERSIERASERAIDRSVARLQDAGLQDDGPATDEQQRANRRRLRANARRRAQAAAYRSVGMVRTRYGWE